MAVHSSPSAAHRPRDHERPGEWRASLPVFSQVVFSSAPHLGLHGGGDGGFASSLNLVHATVAQGDTHLHTPRHGGAVVDALPGWLLMTLRMSQTSVRALFQSYENGGVRSVPMGEFADALGDACGLELTQVEMSTLLRCIAPVRGEEPPPLHMPLADLRRAPLDVGLLGRAILVGEKRSASEYIRRGSSSPNAAGESPIGSQAWTSRCNSQASPPSAGTRGSLIKSK